MPRRWWETVAVSTFDKAAFAVFMVAWLWATAVLLGSLALAAASLVAAHRARRLAPLLSDEGLRVETAPLLTALLPAHNEAPVIVDSVAAMLASTYPALEVIVIDDGSTDGTLDRLREAYDLVQGPPPPPRPGCETGPVLAEWRPRRPGVPLRVLRKESVGSKADALNAGLCAASGELLYAGDADGLPEPEALARVVDGLAVAGPDAVGAGGTILPLNSAVTRPGLVVQGRAPRGWLPRIQTVEYMRAFLAARPGLGGMRSLPRVSGAFGVFRTAEVRAAGGWGVGHLGEDMDLAVRLVARARAQGRAGYLVPVPHAVLWTQVPDSWAVLRRQRVRWAKGLYSVMGDYWPAMLRPKSAGRIGPVGLMWMGATEMAAPWMEVAGVVSGGYLVAAGLLPWKWALAAVVATWLLAFAQSAAALWIHEHVLGRFPHRGDFARLLAAAAVEPLGYHQVTVWWRIRASVGNHGWGHMPRSSLSHLVPHS